MKKIVVIYDDSQKPNKEIATITGNKSYGETIFKRVTLKDRMKEEIRKEENVIDILEYQKPGDEVAILEYLGKKISEIAIVHLYSNFALASTEGFKVVLKKAAFVEQNYIANCDGKLAMAVINGASEYIKNFERLTERTFSAELMESDAFMDLSDRGHFLTFITSGFDARFFNALLGDEYTVTKRSSKIAKIKAEHDFYYLLPDHMKKWFVQPYNYVETKEYASYTMERFHMTDIAIRFVHGAIDAEELKDILEKLFYFVGTRETKEVSYEKAKEINRELYVDKLLQRMEELKKLKEYEQFNHMLQMGTKYKNLEELTNRYLKLYEKLTPFKQASGGKCMLAIGHGDMCFSNILYNKEASILKLIDPKGALTKEELFTDPYYDLAKLSHSVCGCYDFFNSGLYQISIDRDMKCGLSIDTDPEPFVAMFKAYLEKNGYDYRLVRLYEASLFLSMLPYHMDQPGKVFGFILNAIRILEEIES